jgi:hypothetical protein
MNKIYLIPALFMLLNCGNLKPIKDPYADRNKFDGYYAVYYTVQDSDQQLETQFKIENNKAKFQFTDQTQHSYKININVNDDGHMTINANMDTATLIANGTIDDDGMIEGSYTLGKNERTLENQFNGKRIAKSEVKIDATASQRTMTRMFSSF